VFIRLCARELAEGPGPRWLGIVPNGLYEQPCPHKTIIETLAVFGNDFEQPSAADGDCLQP
jgi:hypothetical protein